MTTTQFFDAYEGLWIESTSIDNTATRDQCVDVFRVFNRKVIGGNEVGGNAVDYWTNYPTDFYEKVPNAPDNFPHLGDVVVWGTKYGPYGHIAVCTDISDVNGFTSFDQNDPLKSKCHYQPHKYTGVLGWLRPKKLPSEEPTQLQITDKTKIPCNGTWGDMELQAIKSTLNDQKATIDSQVNTISGLERDIDGVETQIKVLLENQKDIAEKLGCGISHDEIMKEISKLVTLEDQHNGITEDPLTKFLNSLVQLFKRKEGDK